MKEGCWHNFVRNWGIEKPWNFNGRLFKNLKFLYYRIEGLGRTIDINGWLTIDRQRLKVKIFLGAARRLFSKLQLKDNSNLSAFILLNNLANLFLKVRINEVYRQSKMFNDFLQRVSGHAAAPSRQGSEWTSISVEETCCPRHTQSSTSLIETHH